MFLISFTRFYHFDKDLHLNILQKKKNIWRKYEIVVNSELTKRKE